MGENPCEEKRPTTDDERRVEVSPKKIAFQEKIEDIEKAVAGVEPVTFVVEYSFDDDTYDLFSR